MSPIGRMIQEEKWDDLAAATTVRFGTAISASRLQTLISSRKIIYNYGSETWSDCTWWMFVKNRLDEGGYFGRPGCSILPIDDGWRCVLHVGFLSIIETPEELDRLQRGETGRKRNYNDPARSAIFRELPKGNVHPIDRTAMIVAPEDHP
jgi:hypothetical protein